MSGEPAEEGTRGIVWTATSTDDGLVYLMMIVNTFLSKEQYILARTTKLGLTKSTKPTTRI
jgi:hypothetical protein